MGELLVIVMLSCYNLIIIIIVVVVVVVVVLFMLVILHISIYGRRASSQASILYPDGWLRQLFFKISHVCSKATG